MRYPLDIVAGISAWTVAWGLAPQVLPRPTSDNDAAATPASTAIDSIPASLTPPDEPRSGTGWGPRAVASYTIEARLDTEQQLVEGTSIIQWQNTSQRAQNELWFHLYLNAFRDAESDFLRTGTPRFGARLPGSWGSIEVEELTADGLEGDLWRNAATHSPGAANDATDIRVPLPRSVAPGGSLTLRARFVARLPELFDRVGYQQGFYLVAQWFPKLARLEPNGDWSHFTFHPQSEFYADFGDYDVTLDVPRHLIVGATGECTRVTTNAARQRLRFQVRSVHDFAWTAWDRFRQHSTRRGDVSIHVLFPPGYEASARHTLDAITLGLSALQQRYGRYPYPTLTAVHPPDFARAAAGMEYPTFIITGAPWYAAYGTRAVETVTVHELAHQWFYGMIATNEHDLPVLDEGLATWAESLVMDQHWGAGSALDLPGWSVSAEALRRATVAEYGKDDVVVQPAPDFASFASIGALVYAKTAVTLRTLANVYGQQRVDTAIAAYARHHRFAHPRWSDFLATFRQDVGEEGTTQLRRALEGRGWVDFVAQAPDCSPSPDGTDLYACRALVQRRGDLELPVSIELEMEDGSRATYAWNGRGNHFVVRHVDAHRVRSVWVDPHQAVLLDENLLNNAYSRSTSLPLRSVERATYVAQLLLWGAGP